MNCGILYVATGQRYVDEAQRSAASAKRQMPDLPRTLHVDAASEVERGLFTEVRLIEKPTYTFFDKILPLIESPYERTLFLDTDTLVIDPVQEVFELLDRFDLGYVHGPWRACPGYALEACPSAFAEPNTGVILYRRGEAVKDLFSRWANLYAGQLRSATPPAHDQPAFRQVLYESSLRFVVLPPEYNFRTVFPGLCGGGLRVKILHGRDPSLGAAEGDINSREGVRLVDYTSAVPGPRAGPGTMV